MMKRGSTWYVKRRFVGLGSVYKSLGTKNKARARRLEDMLLDLHDKGRADLVGAWIDGTLPLERLATAYDSGQIAELSQSLIAEKDEDVSLSRAIAECLRLKSPDVRASTLKRYREGLGHLQRFAGQKATVRDTLTTRRLQEFKALRVSEKAARATINCDLIACGVLSTYCIDEGWLAERPTIEKYETPTRIRWLEADQVRLYMATLRRPFRPLFQLLIGSGMRLGEAEALRVCDLSFNEDGGLARVEHAKSEGGIRRVFFPAWVADALRATISERGLSGDARLFTIPRRTVQKEHHRACKLAGIVRYTIHDHRHTAAVSLARSGLPLHLLQKQLGHSDIKMTMGYAEFYHEYGDVRPYFDRVARSLDVGSTSGSTPAEAESEARE